MSSNKKILSVFIVFVLTLLSIVTPSTASANIWPSASSLELIKSTCPSGSDQHPKITHLTNEITAAGNINQAREMALAPIDGAIYAIQKAHSIMPFGSDDLRTAETRLSDARSRILVASSQKQVADEFSGMLLAGLDDDSAARVSAGNAGCNYSTGEIIGIVVGLILGIIPGLILLFVLC
ncbi:hypothetical protein [Methylobacter sp. YRD-M1]|uniref:hypothetical protein n=1 Tax=Methylobacter sp. YRD-M1 TaxID=2911520 RepID=UPI00227BC8A5|nr:hypothetical protein [Methylobacter sp. YRD-M1]WAK03829.1 hypothetical protein LZ558_08605 [Methylobacter sp. YRD-M1]